MSKQHFCPECLENEYFEEIYKDEKVKIKGEEFNISAHYLQCENCNEEILDPSNQDENFIKAYNIYRKKKNLLIPNEIVELRKKYGLSQRMLAKILGWSHVTLSRYESGALQSISHNNELVLIRDPKNMMKILKQNKDNIEERDFKKIYKVTQNIINDENENNLYRVIESTFMKDPSEYTGYRRFNLDEVVKLLRFFMNRDENITKVKLLKYLWYTDFFHFKKRTVSLTGLRYIKYPMGPVPEEYELLIKLILNQGNYIERDYIDYGYHHLGERFSQRTYIDESEFTRDELETLNVVYKFVSPHNSTSISELSHTEEGWLETDDKGFISYNYADSLSID